MSEVEEGRLANEDVPGLKEFMREVTEDDPPDSPEEDLHSLARSIMQRLSEKSLSKDEKTMPAPAKESHDISYIRGGFTNFQKLPDFLQWIELRAYKAAEFPGISFAQALSSEIRYVEDRADKLRIPPEEAAMIYAEHGTLEGIDPEPGEGRPAS